MAPAAIAAGRTDGIRRHFGALAVQLNRFTDYALRILIYCALQDGRTARTSEIARAYAISENHLTKVAQQLAACGFLTTARGRAGGLRLARPAGEIGVGDVIRCTEGSFRLVECFDDATNTCPLAASCRLQATLERALTAFFLVLDGYTLADLTSDPDRLRTRLRRAAVPPRTGARSSE